MPTYYNSKNWYYGFGNDVTKGWLNRSLFDNRSGQALPAMKEFDKFR